jgi:hypothetical protein
LSESRGVILARILSSLMFFPLIFYTPVQAYFGGLGFIGLVLVSCGLFYLRIKIGQQMEKRADRVAAQTMMDSTDYARALEKIYRLNLMPAVMPRRTGQVHPNLYDRMLTAGLTPDFPRPAPAARGKAGFMMLLVYFGLLFILGITNVLTENEFNHYERPPRTYPGEWNQPANRN